MKRNSRIQFVLQGAAVLAVALCLGGCGGKKVIKEQPPCEQRYNAAMEKFDQKKFDDAKDIFQEILYRCSGTAQTPEILFHLGMSYYHIEKYDQAEYQFRDLIRDFHSSPLAEVAQFMIGRTLLAQTGSPDRDMGDAQKAIDELKAFLEEYPQGTYADSARFYILQGREKMAQKEFQAGRLYSRMQEPKAASIYFRAVIDTYCDTRWALPARYELAMSLSKEGRKSEALEAARELQAEKIPDDLRKKNDELITRLEREQ